jgi:hypothetical protein
MDARGKQLMREWWTLKLAKEANEAELASMFTDEKKYAHPSSWFTCESHMQKQCKDNE